MRVFKLDCICTFIILSSNHGAIKNSLTPMITSGKYEKVGSQLLMPVNIKVHHAAVDGYYGSLFFEILQREMNG